MFVLAGGLGFAFLLIKGWAALRAPTVNRMVEDAIRELEGERGRS